MKFEWDPKKAAKNSKKHGVSFKEAATVFGDPESMTFDDPDHSADEGRFLTIGKSKAGKVLFISHTDRSGGARIISARRATVSEKKYYEEEKSRR